MTKLVLVRHGESEWNKLNLFTGWTDVELSDKGREEAKAAAHGNSLRALVKYLDNLTPEQILEVNIPTGTPLVYEFDDNFKVIKHYYLGDQKALKAKMEAVANQGKKK